MNSQKHHILKTVIIMPVKLRNCCVYPDTVITSVFNQLCENNLFMYTRTYNYCWSSFVSVINETSQWLEFELSMYFFSNQLI